MSNIPDSIESKRLDDLTAYNSTLLNALSGDALDVTIGSELKRRGRVDAAYRQAILNSVHPDDIFACLARYGVTLSSLGIIEVK